MRMFVASVIAVCLGFGCTLSRNPSEPSTPTDGPSRTYDDVADGMRERIAKLMTQHEAAGLSIAVLDEQHVVWIESFGVAKREGAVPVTDQTSYEIGSLSKLFVGVAVMQLVEARELDLDAPITDYIPELQLESRFAGVSTPTLRLLMSHRSGLPADIPGLLGSDGYSISQLPNRLQHEWLVQPPGQMAIYSSVGVDLAALVVERVTRTEFSAHLEKAVLEPMGMSEASLRAENTETAMQATGYDWAGLRADSIGYTPSASLRASISELAQLVRLANGRGRVGGAQILSANSVAEMIRPQNVGRPLDLGAMVGLTWFIEPGSQATGDIVRHTGTTNGFMSEIKLLPKHKLGVVALGNSKNLAVLPRVVDEALARALFVKARLDFEAELKTVEAVPAAPEMEIDTGVLDAIAATAYSDGNTLLRFERHRRHLRTAIPRGRHLLLTPRPDGTFDTEVRGPGRRKGEPFPAPRVSFETLDGEQVMVARGDRAAWVYAKRFEAGKLGQGWMARTGSYRPLVGRDVVERLELRIEHGGLRIDAVVSGESEPLQFVLEAHSETLATVAGLGRGSGAAVVAFDRDGKHCLRAQGLEFVQE